MTPVVDVHTHMLNREWLALLEKHGRPRYTLATVPGGLRAIHLDGAPFMTPVPEMFDWDLRVKNMDRAGIDVSVVSLTCPNCYWGGEAVSLKAAQLMNDEMARARKAFPDRVQWFCSLPWQYPKAAVKELARALKAGASRPSRHGRRRRLISAGWPRRSRSGWVYGPGSTSSRWVIRATTCSARVS